MKRFVVLTTALFLVPSALPGHAFQVTGSVTGYSASGIKYVYMIPFSLDDLELAIVNPLNNTYKISNADSSTYIVFAFQDVNTNLLPGLDEPRGYYGGQPAVPLELVSDTSGIDIELHPPQTGGFSGTISYAGSDSGITYIGAYDNADLEGEMKGFGMMLNQAGNGTYTAIADSGTFYAHCFMDVNFNFQIDPGEPYGIYGGPDAPQPFVVTRTEWPNDIDMELTAQGVGVDETGGWSSAVPEAFILYQNYPNPFNPTTEIPFHLSRAGRVRLDVYNILGQTVRTLVDGHMGPGHHTVRFDAAHLANGVYLYQIQVGELQRTRKMVLLK